MEKKRIGIIGGGISGTCLGYHLSLYDNAEVIVFEKDTIGGASTAKSAGTVCLFDDSLRNRYWDVRLYGFESYLKMEAEEKGSAGFDKTGTLTKGVFEVESCEVIPGVSKEELIRIIASVEKNSTHPIAKAIVSYAEKKKIGLTAAENIEEVAGYGLMTEVDGEKVLVGNARLLSKYSIEFPAYILSITETTVVCAVGNKYIGYITLSDVLKDDAADTVRSLKELNIKNIQILSGDKQSIVSIFANKLGLTRAYGDLLPEGKVEHMEKLKENKDNRIAFVGDGMNDAPVLALSDVGIAMGGLGSDAAIETADVVIQTDQPSKVATAIKVGRCTRRIIWQNVSLAFGVKLLVMVLGASGIATLWEAVFADVGVTLIAIVNAIRIQKMIK